MNGSRVFYGTVIVLLTLAAAYLLIKVGQVLIVLFIAILFASTIRPLVDALTRRRVPRGLAILIVYLLILLGIAGLLIVSVPPLVGLVVELFSGDLIASRIQPLVQRLAFLGWTQFHIVIPSIEIPRQLSDLLGQAGVEVQKLAWPVASNFVLMVSQIVLIFVMGVYWLTAREPMLNLLLRMSPLRHRARVEQIWTDIELTLGAFARGQFLLMLVIGFADLIGLLILGVPYAPALAVIAGLTEAIPVVGPFLGAAPAILMGLTVSGETALFVAGWYILIQQLENHILVPKVMERTVGLNPLVVILALVVGGMLHGVIGALLAVPVAGALQVLFRHLLIEPTIQSHELRTEAGIVLLGEEQPGEIVGPLAEENGRG